MELVRIIHETAARWRLCRSVRRSGRNGFAFPPAMLQTRNSQSEIRNSHMAKLFVRQYATSSSGWLSPAPSPGGAAISAAAPWPNPARQPSRPAIEPPSERETLLCGYLPEDTDAGAPRRVHDIQENPCHAKPAAPGPGFWLDSPAATVCLATRFARSPLP